MAITPELTDAYRLVRAYGDALAQGTSSTFRYRTAAKWEEMASVARALAEECDKIAAIAKATNPTDGT